MSNRLALSVAQDRLTELVAEMRPGDEIVLTQNDVTVAVVTKPVSILHPRLAGSAAHRHLWMAEDFDEPLEDFKEYDG